MKYHYMALNRVTSEMEEQSTYVWPWSIKITKIQIAICANHGQTVQNQSKLPNYIILCTIALVLDKMVRYKKICKI
jgi:hypothetical protein